MNLTIDIGNTRNKIAIFDQDEIVETAIIEDLNDERIEKIKEEYNIDAVILSSVKNPNKKLINYLQSNIELFIDLDEHTAIPIENLYNSKSTLGKDRLAAVVGANNIFPDTNVLVIDLGTAITFDLVNNKNQYLGGTISPGLNLRFKALNQFTDQLPLLEKREKFDIIGNDTDSAIISGVQTGIKFEIEGYIHQLQNDYDRLKTILTGGDAIFFDKMLKNTIFVNLNLNFVGLNTILEFNKSR